MNRLLAGSLRRRLSAAVLVFGLFTMFVLVGIRGWVVSGRADTEIRRAVELESVMNLPAVSEALWIYDRTLLEAVVRGIVSSPEISYAAVAEGEKIVIEAGKKLKGSRFERTTEIVHKDHAEKDAIGLLVVQGDESELRKISFKWLMEDLPLTALGISIIAIFIWFYVTHTVTGRLVTDAAALERFDQESELLPFPLGAIPAKDEISLLETKFDESIIALRSSVKEKEVLLRELYHRTNNNMQTILGLIALGAPRTEDPAALRLLSNIESKVYAMALVHQMLYRHKDLSVIPLEEYVPQVAYHLAESERAFERSIRFEFDLAPAPVTVDFAIPFALILAELVENALRHAYPAGKGGAIRIGLRNVPGGILSFSIADDGVGTSIDFGDLGEGAMGLDLVRSLARNQLGGTAEFSSIPGAGFCCEINSRPGKFKARV